jgi:hypothetical protein
MELFPAADDEQWAFIRRVIDDSDYYLLIVGGRYGSLTEEGISYTETEFDYAVGAGVPVLAFLHEQPDELIPSEAQEPEAALEKLSAFRERIEAGRLVRYWSQPADLPGLVALSLTKAIRAYPRVGWIRASEAASVDVLNDLNDLRKERDALASRVRELEGVRTPELPNLAGLDDSITLHGTRQSVHRGQTYPWEFFLTFREIFALLSPYLLDHPSEGSVKTRLKTVVLEAADKKSFRSDLVDQDFQTVKLQLIALGLVKSRYSKTIKGGMATFWSLTAKGERLMYESRTLQKD